MNYFKRNDKNLMAWLTNLLELEILQFKCFYCHAPKNVQGRDNEWYVDVLQNIKAFCSFRQSRHLPDLKIMGCLYIPNSSVIKSNIVLPLYIGRDLKCGLLIIMERKA